MIKCGGRQTDRHSVERQTDRQSVGIYHTRKEGGDSARMMNELIRLTIALLRVCKTTNQRVRVREREIVRGLNQREKSNLSS